MFENDIGFLFIFEDDTFGVVLRNWSLRVVGSISV